MLFLQPMLVNARALLEGWFTRPREADAARVAPRSRPKAAAPESSVSDHGAIGVPEECTAAPSPLEAQLVLRRLRHFEQDMGRR